ncbi:MAG: TIGR04133 family radical SAM/SPASM protein [Bacteroidales bacterium]|nr:TIGR04133 family radical SAM/SPASM protein [Bacteroidales bacterium]
MAYWNTERLKITHPLRQLFWECTLNCNLSCLHCGSDCNKEIHNHEMPLNDFLTVLDVIKTNQPNEKTMVYTVGGEPLVRKDIVECGRAITKKGFYWGTVTNGQLLDKVMLQELMKAGLRTISIDIDGTKEDHNWLRNSDNSFDYAYNALVSVQNTPHLVWDVITCVNHRNFYHLDEIKRMLIEAGVRHWRCFTITPMGRAKANPELILSDEELKKLMNFIVQTRIEGKIHLSYGCEGYLGDYEGQVRDNYYSCRAGLTVASILNNGGISGCLSIRSDYQQGNIYQDNFWDVWNNRFKNYRNREWMRNEQCEECEVFKYCQGSGMHLRDSQGKLMLCHYNKLKY